MPNYNRFDMRKVIDSYIINARHREVLRLRYCEGFSYDEISGITNFSPQHCKHLCKAYRDVLLSHI